MPAAAHADHRRRRAPARGGTADACARSARSDGAVRRRARPRRRPARADGRTRHDARRPERRRQVDAHQGAARPGPAGLRRLRGRWPTGHDRSAVEGTHRLSARGRGLLGESHRPAGASLLRPRAGRRTRARRRSARTHRSRARARSRDPRLLARHAATTRPRRRDPLDTGSAGARRADRRSRPGGPRGALVGDRGVARGAGGWCSHRPTISP